MRRARRVRASRARAAPRDAPSVSAVSMTPSRYLIARTDVPVTMGDVVALCGVAAEMGSIGAGSGNRL